MDDRERFERRRRLASEARKRAHLVVVADEEEVRRIAASSTEGGRQAAERLRMACSGESDDMKDPAQLLDELREAIAGERIDALVSASRHAIIDALVRPFGLGRLVAAMDRRGGAVLTLHNAKVARDEGWSSEFAEPEKLDAFRERLETPYDRSAYNADPARRAEIRARHKDDAYTGKPLGDDVDIDHVVAARELHDRDDLAFHLTEQRVVDLALSDENLVPTDGSLNSSKGAKPLSEWMDDERLDGTTNEEFYEVDRERATAVDRNARAKVDAVVRSAALRNYATAALKSGATQAASLGLQQAVGLLLVELVEALFDEITGLIRARPVLDSALLDRLGRSLRAVAQRVVARWMDAVAAFRDGAVGGFLSTLVTMVLNLFLTTSRRVVRMLREGVYSLVRAVNLTVAPPTGMTREQAVHEACKVLAGGLAVAGGVAVEEAVEKALASVPLLAPFASTLSIVVVGTGVGLATVLLAYFIDEADIVGVRRSQEARRLDVALDQELEAALAALELGLTGAGSAGR